MNNEFLEVVIALGKESPVGHDIKKSYLATLSICFFVFKKKTFIPQGCLVYKH